MDFARKETETAAKQLEEEIVALENLLAAQPVDLDAITLQKQNVDAEIENYFAFQNTYKELLGQKKMDVEYEQEMAKRKAIRKKKTAAVSAINKLYASAATPASSSSIGAAVGDTSTYRVHLPKREMPKFSGDVRQWKSFWASFQEVDNDPSVPRIEKYNYLLQCMVPGSSAHKVVDSFPAADTSYELAKKELEHRFGRPKTLIKVYVRDLLALVIENAKDKKTYNFVDVITNLQSQILNLEQLGVTQDKFGLLLYPIIESCIPADVLNRYLDMPGVKEELEDIMEFLRNEVRRKEESARAQEAFSTAEKEDKQRTRGSCKNTGKQHVPTATSFINATGKQQCGFCGFAHATAECRKAITMTLEERKEALKKSKACFKCLKIGHDARKCNTKILCITCKKNHHALMCYGVEPQIRVDQLQLNPNPPDWNTRATQPLPQFSPQAPLQTNAIQPAYENRTFGPGTSVSLVRGNAPPRIDMKNYIQKAEVLVQTQRCYAYGKSAGGTIVRVMHDGGSQSTYIRRSLAMELQLKPVGFEKVIHQTFGAVLSKEMEHPVVQFEISGLNAPYSQRFIIEASVLENLGKDVIAVPQGPWIQECQEMGIPLTDVIGEAADIDIIIGNDISPYLKVGMRSTMLPCGLVATECRLGWFLEAMIPGSAAKNKNKAMVCLNMQITDKDVSNYWALETIGIHDAAENKTRNELEEAAMNHFRETVQRQEDGRYIVHLPWIEGHPSLPDNRQLVYRRLEKTTKDLVRDGYLQEYDSIFRDWEKTGIIEKVPAKTPPTGVVHYLGHRAVYKEGSTTPVRPVFNASGRTKLSPSLNDCLEKGPNLLEIIPSILSRFRLEKIGVCSDIRKAFLQLLVTQQHRDCLRFLWWEDAEERKTIIEYRHCRVVFGVSSSPFLLGAAIKELLEKNKDKFPKTVAILQNSFYVDNCVASLPSLEEVVKFKEESEQMFLSAQMDLRGWEFGPTSDGKIVPVLGMLWETGGDTLSFEVKNIMKKMDLPITKRTVLTLANSFYDPLGLLCPFIITIKIVFKKVCLDEQKYAWDTVLPENIQKEVENWKRQVPSVGSLKIPRLVTVPELDRSNWSLHVMADASKEAYACCVYLRIEAEPVKVQLIQARARVTPAKVLTIPRAELLGCLIAARLYSQVVEDLRIPDVPVTFWTDSTTALIWITKTQSVWATFVNRRVEEIRKLTNVSDWKHVPGEINPADYPSRGIPMEKYFNLQWWEGPQWLFGPPSSFPNSQPEIDQEAVEQEKRKAVVSNIAVSHHSSYPDSLLRLGDWHQIVRVVAMCFTFARKCRKQLEEPTIGEEIKQAELAIFRHIQQTMTIPPGLQTCRDNSGVIRIVTKLVDGKDNDFNYPIVLPGSHPLARLLIIKEHSLASHGGVQYIMTILRQRYWIVNARRSVKAVINKCSICRVHMAKRCTVVEPPLPLNRIVTTYCFDVVGVDLAGPLILKNGEKVWVVLYTCAVYRAVHLELVSSLSTEAFLQTLRKFVARRGRPSIIYSDNGTNFRGCHNLFKSVDWRKVEQYASVSRISWIFNAPTGAWWGGFWERLVGMMKQLLRRVLGKRSVHYSELEVLLLEVEAVLNERPLTYISEDPVDLRPLTPSLFLRDLPVACLPEADVTAGALRRNLKHIQRLREGLRTRFKKEYLSQLVCSGKTSKSIELTRGDVVLVEVDNKKRVEWPMGIIIDVYPGRDGRSRTAKVRTTQGEITRPFQRLFPLEMKSDSISGGITKEMEVPKPRHCADEEADDNLDIDEDFTYEEVEPVVVTKFGRAVKKPDRYGV